MTDAQREMVTALQRCSFLPGSFDKRFVRDVAAQERDLTVRQDECLRGLAHKYRRQIGRCLDPLCPKCQRLP